MPSGTKKIKNGTSYSKWGYIFLIPFFAVFTVVTLIPLFQTFYYSFFEIYKDGSGIMIEPKFVGLKNYADLLTLKGYYAKNPFAQVTFWQLPLIKATGNTVVMWIIGFIPQIVVSLLFAAWFSDARLRLKGQGFFKTVMYMPNIIMAAAFSMMIYSFFSRSGPIGSMFVQAGWKAPNGVGEFEVFQNAVYSKLIVSMINFLMWFGNTTILLLAGMLGIDATLYEAGQVDGATPNQMFTKITLPLLQPILVYVMITSMIGGLQMFDVPQIITNGQGNPDNSLMTVIMLLNRNMQAENYGIGGAISVLLFAVTAVFGIILFRSTVKEDKEKERSKIK